MNRLILAGLAVALALTLTAPAGNAAEPRIVAGYTSNFTNVQPPARNFDLVQGVSEFQPGESARMNSLAASPRFFTVIEGEVSITIGNRTEVYAAGSSFSVAPGIFFLPRNDSTSRARILFSILQPAWERGAQFAPDSTAPEKPSRILYGVRTNVTVASNLVTVQQVTSSWESGARNSPHIMNHPHVFATLDGEVTTRYLDGGEDRIGPGQLGVMTVGRPGIMESTGERTASMAFTWVITLGTPNTSPAAVAAASPALPVALPRTGDGGMPDSGPNTPIELLGLAAALAGAAALSLHFRSGRP
jgi:quercetin dioxygenase-like cupin family protein